MFKPSEEAHEDSSKRDVEPYSKWRTTDSPPSPFVQMLQSAVESKNCELILHLPRDKCCICEPLPVQGKIYVMSFLKCTKSTCCYDFLPYMY